VVVTDERGWRGEVGERQMFWARGEIEGEGAANGFLAPPRSPRTRQFLEKFLLQ